MQAYRIVNWWKFEVLKNGRPAAEKTRMASLRIKELRYVRFPVHGHNLSPDYRRLVKRAGPDLAAACDGLYKMLVGLAGNQVRQYRGWILDDRQQPLKNPEELAEILCVSKEKVAQILEILTDREVKWVEFLVLPEALHKSLNSNELTQKTQNIYFGNNQEKKGAHLIETETEGFSKDKGFETEAVSKPKERVWENSGELEREYASGGGEENVQPQARPPASVSGSDTASDTDSDSEKLSDSGSDSATVPASDSKPAAGPGAMCPEHLSKQQSFEIIRACKLKALELTQIIPPRNTSDTTTINDIYMQLQQRLLSGCPYPLLEMSIKTARQCWRGVNPIAMFVAAMKKSPFNYVPKKLSVIPGKFSQGRNTNRKS